LLAKVARSALAGRLALFRGETAAAVRILREGIAAEDDLPYAEPSLWRAPLREALGAALLRTGRPAEAETVFREDLKRNPGNGRSLFGLWQSLEAQARRAEARRAASQFRRAWRRADTTLAIASL
jgi:tetratricopeptide (TPR) repeat protein